MIESTDDVLADLGFEDAEALSAKAARGWPAGSPRIPY